VKERGDRWSLVAGTSTSVGSQVKRTKRGVKSWLSGSSRAINQSRWLGWLAIPPPPCQPALRLPGGLAGVSRTAGCAGLPEKHRSCGSKGRGSCSSSRLAAGASAACGMQPSSDQTAICMVVGCSYSFSAVATAMGW
jgi:hypothetical protein